MSQSLHPDVKKFKAFVRDHPYVLRDVKKGEKTLQDLFEEWMLFGEEDEIWSSYARSSNDEEEKSAEKNSSNDDSNDQVETDLLNMLKKMNLNDLQHHLAQFSTVMGSVQELINQFSQNKQSANPPPNPEQQSPFSFRED